MAANMGNFRNRALLIMITWGLFVVFSSSFQFPPNKPHPVLKPYKDTSTRDKATTNISFMHMYNLRVKSLVKTYGSDETKVSEFSGSSGSLLDFLKSNSFAIGSGCTLLVLLIINRLFTPDLYDSQSRSDIITVITTGSLILNAFSDVDVKVREAEKVELEGPTAYEYSKQISTEQDRKDIEWAAETLLTTIPCKSILIYYQGKTLARFGVVGKNKKIVRAPILDKAMKADSELYLPALQVLPGKVEFDYLPENCQSVLIQPIPGRSPEDEAIGAVVMGGDQARCFTQRDIAVSRRVVQRVALLLDELFASN